MVHSDIFKLKIDFDAVIDKEIWEIDELIPKILDELIVDVGYPRLKLYGNVLKQKVNAFIFLKHWLNLYHMFIL
jgi:hypothetical protein